MRRPPADAGPAFPFERCGWARGRERGFAPHPRVFDQQRSAGCGSCRGRLVRTRRGRWCGGSRGRRHAAGHRRLSLRGGAHRRHRRVARHQLPDKTAPAFGREFSGAVSGFELSGRILTPHRLLLTPAQSMIAAMLVAAASLRPCLDQVAAPASAPSVTAAQSSTLSAGPAPASRTGRPPRAGRRPGSRPAPGAGAGGAGSRPAPPAPRRGRRGRAERPPRHRRRAGPPGFRTSRGSGRAYRCCRGPDADRTPPPPC